MVSLRKRKSFKKEFRYQVKTAVIVAIGFIIAYAWKEAIFNSAEKLVSRFSETTGFISSQLITALLLTFIGVLLIFITSKLLRN